MRDMDFERLVQRRADEAQPLDVREAWANQVRRATEGKGWEGTGDVVLPKGKRAHRVFRTQVSWEGKPQPLCVALSFFSEAHWQGSTVPPWCSPNTGKAKKVKHD